MNKEQKSPEVYQQESETQVVHLHLPVFCLMQSFSAVQYSAWQETENWLYSVCSLCEEISFGKFLQEILLQISFMLD